MFAALSSQEGAHSPAAPQLGMLRESPNIPGTELQAEAEASSEEIQCLEEPNPQESRVPSSIEKFFLAMQDLEPRLYQLPREKEQIDLVTSQFQPLVSRNKIVEKCNCIYYASVEDFPRLFQAAAAEQSVEITNFVLYQVYLRTSAEDAFCAEYVNELAHIVTMCNAEPSLLQYFATKLFCLIILSKELATSLIRPLKQLIALLDEKKREYYAALFDIETNLPITPQFSDEMSFRVALVHENVEVATHIIVSRRLTQKERMLLSTSPVRLNERIQELLTHDFAFCQLVSLDLPLCGFEQKCEVVSNIERYYRTFFEYLVIGVRRGVLRDFVIDELEWIAQLDDVERCLVISALVEASMWDVCDVFRKRWSALEQ